MIHIILRLFVKTLTVDEKHYLLKRDSLRQIIRMQLSKKQKTFSEIFFAFLKSVLNFKYFPKKGDSDTDVFSEIPAPKKMVR